MTYCTGNCQQGRKPCDCELNADQGDFVSPVIRNIENGLAALIVIIALVGLCIIVWELP